MRRYTYYENKKWRIKVGDTELTGPWVDRLSYYEEIAPDPEAMRDEAYDLGYRSCLHYKGLTWDEAKELQAYRKTGLTVERAAELGKADREGRVLVLPCQEGSNIYVIYPHVNAESEIEKRYFSLIYFSLNDFGKRWFLTREEAEKALEAENHERPDD